MPCTKTRKQIRELSLLPPEPGLTTPPAAESPTALHAKSVGVLAEPGRILTKAERAARARRKDFALSGENREEQPKPEEPSVWAKIKAALISMLEPMDLDTHCISRPEFGAPEEHNLHRVIRSSILILLAFGASHILLEYLLSATRASASTCIPGTVFVPVVSTVMSCPSSLVPAVTLTSTSVFTHTTTITPAPISAAGVLSSSGGPSYYYSIVNGTTAWLNGIAPSSGASLTTATESIFISPASTIPATTIHLTSTATKTQTITVPPYTSTVYSLVPQNSTTTSYRTVYTTISLDSVTTITGAHSSFSGVGGSGWNVTSSVFMGAASTGVASVFSESTTTMSGVFYWGTGSVTISTSTQYLTTTIHVTGTTTITPTSVTFTVESDTSSNVVSPVATSESSSTPGFATLTPGSSGILPSSGVAATGSAPGSTTPFAYPPSYLTTISDTSSSAVPANSSTTVNGVTAHGNSTTIASSDAVSTSAVSSTTVISPAEVTSASYGPPSSFPGNITLSSLSLSQLPSSAAVTAGPVSGTVSIPGLLPPSLSINSSASATDSSVKITAISSVAEMTHTLTFPPANFSTSSLSAGTTSSPLLSPTATSLAGYSISTFSVSSILPSTEVFSSSLPTTSSSSSFASSLTISFLSTGVPTNPSSSSKSTPSPTVSASATPTACGEYGNFTLTFDNLPNFNPSNQNRTDITQAPPVPNPYNHLTFSDGYVYAPQPNESYIPRSAPHLAVFLADGTGKTTSTMPRGEIADGMYESSSAFWFDAHSAWFGCDNIGPENCTIVMTGYTWSATANDEIPTFKQNATIPACKTTSNCQLQQTFFPTSFVGLSGLQMQAYVRNEQRMFFLDDLASSWTDNSCQAGLFRQSHR